MKHKIVKTTFLLAVIFASLNVYKPTSANILEITVNDIYLTAGEINRIKISLKNVGELDVYTVEALLSSQIPGIQVLKNSHKVYDEILQGKTKQYHPEIYVNQNTPLGAYTITLNVKYIRYGSVFDSSITVPLGIILSKGFTPRLSYSSEAETVNAKSGSNNLIRYSFTNNWQESLVNVKFSLTSNINYISFVKGTEQSFDEVTPGETIAFEPIISILEGTPLGVYVISAIATYEDDSGTHYFQDYLLPVNVDQATVSKNTVIAIKEMIILGEAVNPGDEFNLQLVLECSGSNAYEVISTLNFPSNYPISPLNPTRTSLGDLRTGDSVKVNYRLLASGDIPAGQYPVTSTVSYVNSRGLPSQVVETSTIMVEGLIDFRLLDEPSITSVIGGEDEIEADLLLIGTESVQFVSVEIVEDATIERVSGSSEYIGAVDPDSPIPFDLKYRVKTNASEGEHDLGLLVRYRDHLNREHQEKLSVKINIGKQAGQLPENQRDSGLWTWLRRLFGLEP